MDIQMPIMDGIEASSQIMNLMKDEKDLTHIVALTSYTNKREACKQAGIKDMFNKPIKAKELHSVINQHFFREDKI